MTEIRTARLLLRRARTDDLHAIHAVLADPRAMTYWSTLPHETLEQSREWLAAMIDGHELCDDFIVEMDDRVIGKAGAWRRPEIGYILHPDAWGMGVATEALTAVIDHLFAAHDDPAITADVDPRNLASIHVLGKLAFRETRRAARTWLIGGQWIDSVYFQLTRDDWAQRA